MDGKTIKEKLRILGYKQTDIAKALNVSHQNIQAALTSHDVKSGLIEKLAAITGVPISFFYTGELPEDFNPLLTKDQLERAEKLHEEMERKDAEIAEKDRQIKKMQFQYDVLIETLNIKNQTINIKKD